MSTPKPKEQSSAPAIRRTAASGADEASTTPAASAGHQISAASGSSPPNVPVFAPKAPPRRRKVAGDSEPKVDILAGPAIKQEERKKVEAKDRKLNISPTPIPQVKVAFQAPSRQPNVSKRSHLGTTSLADRDTSLDLMKAEPLTSSNWENNFDDSLQDLMPMKDGDNRQPEDSYVPMEIPFRPEGPERPWRVEWRGELPIGLPAYKDPSLPQVSEDIKRRVEMELGNHFTASDDGDMTFGDAPSQENMIRTSHRILAPGYQMPSLGADQNEIRKLNMAYESWMNSASDDSVKAEPKSIAQARAQEAAEVLKAPIDIAAYVRASAEKGVVDNRYLPFQSALPYFYPPKFVSDTGSQHNLQATSLEDDTVYDADRENEEIRIRAKMGIVSPASASSSSAISASDALAQGVSEADVELLTEDPRGELMLFQLPAHVPLKPLPLQARQHLMSSDSAPRLPLSQSSRGAAAAAAAAAAANLTNHPESSDELAHDDPLVVDDASVRSSHLSTLALAAQHKVFVPQAENNIKYAPSGQIGRIVVHKSGKVRLIIGETSLDLASGTVPPFYEEVVSIAASQKGNHMFMMGPVRKHVVASVDVEELIERSKVEAASGAFDASTKDEK